MSALTVGDERAGGWTLIVAMILVAFALRPGIVSMGPILPMIRADFGLSHAMAALLVTIPDLLMGLLALPTPWLARRFGRDKVLLGALLLLCVAMVARPFSQHIAVLLLTTGGVGAGIAISGALFAGLIKAKFPTRAAMMMGIYATALSFGSTISAAATEPLAASTRAGWRLGAGCWSLLAVIAVVAWIMVMRGERKGEIGVAPPPAPASPLPLKNRTAWLVALFFACDNFLFYALLSWTSPMYQEQGVSAARAGLTLASFTAAFMCANPIFGALSRSADRRLWLALSACLASLGILGMAVAPMALPFLWVPLAAFGLGGAFTLGMTLPLDNTHGADEANTWNAFVLTVGYLIAAAGPLLVGALRDVTGSFKMPISLLLVMSAGMLALSPFLKPRPAALHHGQPNAFSLVSQ
ncbi:MAG: MFS transporter [Janthinobacterium lividum]